ncbi:MAG: sulfatase [Vicinamibacteria bacterium]
MRVKRRWSCTSLPVLLAALAGCGGGGAPSAPTLTPSPTPAGPPPNLVVILADDLDNPTTAELPRLPDLMANQGVSFTRAFATQPLCGPSRASILTGQYTHNHLVTNNEPPDNGFVRFRRLEGATVATWLKAAGYRTALVGKYINGYAWGADNGYVPPGWDEWYGHLTSIEDNRYWDYWVNDNGNVYRHGNKAEDYSVDVETKRAVEFIQKSAGRPEPIFLYAAPQAPHTPAFYAERFGAEFRYSSAPRPPSFNESDVRDKPSWIRQITYMTDDQIDEADRFQRYRLRCMRAVEDEVAQILQALDQTGRLANTYVFFLSDNGLLMGQHRAVARKNNAYEETIGIPLMVRGPGVAPRKVDELALNIDLAPTLLELARVPVPDTVDGASLVPFLRGAKPAAWRTDFLVEAWQDGPTYAVRGTSSVYIHTNTEEFEFYDLLKDPWQVDNAFRQSDPAAMAALEKRIQALVACRGATCRAAP